MAVQYGFVTDGIKKELIDIRRDFHRFPESGWTEFYTTYKIIQYLKDLGFDIYYGHDFLKEGKRAGICDAEFEEKCLQRAADVGADKNMIDCMKKGFTGAAAVMRFKEKGPVCVLRFDIDGLAVNESQKEGHKPYDMGFNSQNSGFMHACGHDGHIACGIETARLIAQNRDRLCGEVRVLFQPAEEGCRGAKAVCESGFLDGADFVLGGHIGICSRQTGEIAAMTGGFLCTSKIDVSFRGVSAHAANAPQQGRNALLAAAEFVISANAISRHSSGATMINTGVMKAGTSRNAIPDFAFVQCETRGENDSLNDYMKEELIRRAKGSALSYGCDVEFDIVGEACGFSSNEDLIKKTDKICTEMTGKGTEKKSFQASEDFSNMAVYAEKNGAKAAYFTFGSHIVSEHHSGEFDFDEETLFIETEFMIRAVETLLGLKVTEKER